MAFETENLVFGLSFLVSFLITYISIPSIIRVSKLKNLYDEPDERRVHKESIPTLGGVAIFAGLTISMLLFIDFKDFSSLNYILVAIIILFFVGIKDDILMIAPWTKMSLQILAAVIIVVFGESEITNLHGFFGIGNISRIVGIPLSIFTVIVIINAFNFIDGIDGFSGTIGIIIVSTFGIWFFLVKDYSYTLICTALVGALLAFLRYNVFATDKKIFMGDTGTLILGLLISVLVIEFNQKNLELPKISQYFILPAPAVSFGILIVPLFDLMRIMFIRTIIRKPLFLPDKRHLHHIFLELGYSHIKTVFIISIANIFIIILVFWLSEFVTIRRLLLIILIIGTFLAYIPKILLGLKNKKK
jgi:UDP-N-acetylmuramyl pentapeptide phosphotransferase/UDP-N-acetylglucosamine-1-phosphate transferase